MFGRDGLVTLNQQYILSCRATIALTVPLLRSILHYSYCNSSAEHWASPKFESPEPGERAITEMAPGEIVHVTPLKLLALCEGKSL